MLLDVTHRCVSQILYQALGDASVSQRRQCSSRNTETSIAESSMAEVVDSLCPFMSLPQCSLGTFLH